MSRIGHRGGHHKQSWDCKASCLRSRRNCRRSRPWCSPRWTRRMSSPNVSDPFVSLRRSHDQPQPRAMESRSWISICLTEDQQLRYHVRMVRFCSHCFWALEPNGYGGIFCMYKYVMQSKGNYTSSYAITTLLPCRTGRSGPPVPQLADGPLQGLPLDSTRWSTTRLPASRMALRVVTSYGSRSRSKPARGWVQALRVVLVLSARARATAGRFRRIDSPMALRVVPKGIDPGTVQILARNMKTTRATSGAVPWPVPSAMGNSFRVSQRVDPSTPGVASVYRSRWVQALRVVLVHGCPG